MNCEGEIDLKNKVCYQDPDGKFFLEILLNDFKNLSFKLDIFLLLYYRWLPHSTVDKQVK